LPSLVRPKTMKNTQKGFTLIELMIVIAIIGVLVGVALPQYGQYTKRVKFADVISQAVPIKMAIGLCAQDNNSVEPCDNNYGDIGPVINSRGYVDSISVQNGVITAVGNSEVGGAVYKLNPNYSSTESRLTWERDDNVAKACINSKLCK